MVGYYQRIDRVYAEQFDGSKSMMKKYKIDEGRMGTHNYTLHAWRDIGINIGDYITMGNPQGKGHLSSISKYYFELECERAPGEPMPLCEEKHTNLFEQTSLL